MKLTFLGTRGYIEARTRRHRRHSALLVAYRGRRVMIDCGDDWRSRFGSLQPRAIVLTHAHPDHAGGLRDGARCPVFATEAAWKTIADFPIEARETIEPRRGIEIEGIAFEAFPVAHSIRAPAVGYRIAAGRACIFYCPDLVYVPDRSAALRNVALYIGDGASVTRPLVRRRGDALIGHAPIRRQLTWCGKEGVPEALFTHCGSGIVGGDERSIGPQVARLAADRGVRARIAYDGMTRVLR